MRVVGLRLPNTDITQHFVFLTIILTVTVSCGGGFSLPSAAKRHRELLVRLLEPTRYSAFGRPNYVTCQLCTPEDGSISERSPHNAERKAAGTTLPTPVSLARGGKVTFPMGQHSLASAGSSSRGMGVISAHMGEEEYFPMMDRYRIKRWTRWCGQCFISNKE